MSKYKLLRGFTLLELLIVISIIGILVAVGLASYSSAQKKARDSRRRQDMKIAQDAIEQYYAVNAGYPGAATPCVLTVNSTDYLPAGWPVDPKNTAPYQYVFACTSTSAYCFCAQLEDATKGNSNGSCSYGSATTHYCVSNLQ